MIKQNLFFILFFSFSLHSISFKKQIEQDFKERRNFWRSMHHLKKVRENTYSIPPPPPNLLTMSFKQYKILEMWARRETSEFAQELPLHIRKKC